LKVSIFGKNLRNLWLALGTTALVVVLDQWAKVLAVQYLKGALAKVYLGGFVVVEYAENRGAFLSLGANLSEAARLWIFVIGVFAILIFCIVSLWKSLPHLPTSFAYALVIAGGLGNLIDRIQQGYVVDYVHMGFSWLRTGVFNIADMAISLGLILLLFMQYFSKSPEEKN
jgi:signal peptidase II